MEKIIVFLCLGLMFNVTVLFGQNEKRVYIGVEENAQPLNEVKVYSSTGKMVAVSEVGGFISLKLKKFNFPLIFRKEGYAVRYILSPKDLSDTIFLCHKITILPPILIRGKKIRPREYLDTLWHENNARFVSDTTIYYRLQYTLSFPDEEWTEKAQGVIKVKMIKRKNWLSKSDFRIGVAIGKFMKAVFLGDFNLVVSDKSFWKTKAYQEMKPVSAFYLLLLNPMSAYPTGVIFQNYITKREGLDGLIRDLAFSIKGDSFIFTNYYDTTNLTLEKVIFSNSGNLKQIEFFQPEMPLEKAFSFIGQNTKGYYLPGGKNNFFYTRYEYGGNKTGILKKVVNIGWYKQDNVKCKKTITLTLLSNIPNIKQWSPMPIISLSGKERQ